MEENRADLNTAAQALASLAVAMKQSEARLADTTEHHLQALQRAVASTVQQIHATQSDALDRLRAQVRSALEDGLTVATKKYLDDVQVAARQITAASESAMAQQRQAGARQLRHAWIVLGVAIIAAAGPLLSAHVVLRYYESRVVPAKDRGDLVQAFNQADIVQCGTGLCARVDTKARRRGANNDYLPIKPR
ncbi:hypothetical protein NRY95_05560 [Xanthomonas campestris pv. phormiicola]|nr:hypothetical protein [Xanthomonas campestris pv. phormiicola]UYC17431.1 hypothetical protein NRY95_05560 [Xanthomonas campestris pv. phormiicola]